MKKLVVSMLVSCLLMTNFVACSQESSNTDGEVKTEDSTESGANEAIGNGSLNLFTWEGMFPPEVLAGFSEETGIKINFSNFDLSETMLSKLQVANGGDYDLIIADDYIVEKAISEGLLQKLDLDKLTNIDNVNPIYQNQFFDPTDEYTIPYGAGVMTLVYDPSLTDVEITSYEDLWNEKLGSSIGIIDSLRVIPGITLLSMGESMNTEDIDKIEAAGEKLLELAPNIRVIKGQQLQEDLLAGEISAALMYTSQTTIALMTNPELEVVFPSEGIGFGIMPQFIPINAPNPEAAHLFIDYILRPEIAKQCFEYLGYYSTNKEADLLIEDMYKSFLTLPEDFDANQMEMIQNVSNEALDAYSKVWLAFKDAAE